MCNDETGPQSVTKQSLKQTLNSSFMLLLYE